MFATLVVVLPSASTGGELVVRHSRLRHSLNIYALRPAPSYNRQHQRNIILLLRSREIQFCLSSNKMSEADMRKPNLSCVLVLISIAALIATADLAMAASKAKKNTKVTYDEAWALCQRAVNKYPRDSHNLRYTAGSSCMLRYGYRI